MNLGIGDILDQQEPQEFFQQLGSLEFFQLLGSLKETEGKSFESTIDRLIAKVLIAGIKGFID